MVEKQASEARPAAKQARENNPALLLQQPKLQQALGQRQLATAGDQQVATPVATASNGGGPGEASYLGGVLDLAVPPEAVCLDRLMLAEER